VVQIYTSVKISKVFRKDNLLNDCLFGISWEGNQQFFALVVSHETGYHPSFSATSQMTRPKISLGNLALFRFVKTRTEAETFVILENTMFKTGFNSRLFCALM